MPKSNGRQSVLDEVGDIHAPKGSRQWCVAIVGETRKTLSVLKNDATSAGERLRALREVKAWESLGLVGWSMLLSTIGLSDDEAEALITAKRGKSIGVVLGKHGRPKKGEEKGAEGTFKRGSNNAAYLQARIERDRAAGKHDIHVEDFPSVRQAAIAAGIVKVKTPAEQAIHWLAKCSPDEWNIVVEWMNNQ